MKWERDEKKAANNDPGEAKYCRKYGCDNYATMFESTRLGNDASSHYGYCREHYPMTHELNTQKMTPEVGLAGLKKLRQILG